jgi:hypothetical protein
MFLMTQPRASSLVRRTKPWSASLIALCLVSACAEAAGGAVSDAGTNDAASRPSEEADAAIERPDSSAVADARAATHESNDDDVVNEANVVTITLADSGIQLGDNAGERVSLSASVATITSPGIYRLVGKLSDGQVIVNSQTEGTVKLLLGGVDITARSTNAPIAILAATKAVIMLEDGSDNRLADDDSYTLTASTSEVNAALFSAVDLSIYGTSTSTLRVRGNTNDAISSKAGLVIENATISVEAAVDDAIRGKDYLVIRNATLDLAAGGDGLSSDAESDASRGYIEIDDGKYKLVTDGDAVQAQTDLIIYAGTFELTAGGGSGATLATGVSAKGLKAGAQLVTHGGSFVLDVAEDALHSDDELLIEDGTFTIRAGDDALHAEASLTINGGEVDVTRSYEGLESATITLNGGTLHITASDDGVNVADGAAASGAVIAANGLAINAGYLSVVSEGDGIDSNASIAMQGGTVLVTGPTAQNNAALDYDGSFELKGGLFLAVGSAGMAQAPSASSSQRSLAITYGTSSAMSGSGRRGPGSASTATLPAGELIRILRSDGSELLSFAPSKAWQSVVFSSDQLSAGLTGEIYTGGNCTGSELDGLYMNASCVDGTLRTSFTLANAVTNVNFQ